MAPPSLVRYLLALQRRWWALVALPVVAGVVAAAVSLNLPPTYEAQVSMYVRPASPLAAADPSVAALTSDQIAQTDARLLTEPPLLDQVISEQHLGLSQAELNRNISVTPEGSTTILDITVDNGDPAVAAAIANGLVSDFIANMRQIQASSVTSAQATTPADNFVVVSPATTSPTPVSPQPKKDIVIAIGLVFALTVIAILLLEYFDQNIKTDDDLTEGVELVPIGHIPVTPTRKGKYGELASLVDESPAAEGYKRLRTNLLFSGLDTQLQVIVVTSTRSGEGKSRTSSNLAAVLAAAGHQTLLIDADFRRPSQRRILGVVKSGGLSEVVLGHQTAPEAVLQPLSELPNLWFLSSGSRPPNPSELLGSGRMKSLLNDFRTRFGYIVIDTPPINVVTDSAVLATHADGTLLVVEHCKTTRGALVHAKRQLEMVGARIIGVVVNKHKAQSSSYYYYSDYGKYTAAGESDGLEAETASSEGPSGGESAAAASLELVFKGTTSHPVSPPDQ
ncbi:MAG TPA: polysaccharide biosynthesis tyrosine autokinase [Candidatus Dormibacteraeota bacterium]|nr:polysaccharide biosynthesis tyrosine autokinase [Candidatus Dormibacteraeota bacterium]